MEEYTNLYQHYLKEFSQENKSFMNSHLSFGDYKDIAAEYGVHDADLVCHRELNIIHREDTLETDYVNNVIEEIKGLYEDDRLYGEPAFPDMPSTYEYAEVELQKAVKRGVKEENLEKIADAIEDKGIPSKDLVKLAKEDVAKEYIEEAQWKLYIQEFGVKEEKSIVENEHYSYEDFQYDVEKGGISEALAHGHEKIAEDRTDRVFEKLMERIRTEKGAPVKESKNMAAAIEFEKPIEKSQDKTKQNIGKGIDRNIFKNMLNQMEKESYKPTVKETPTKSMNIGMDR